MSVVADQVLDCTGMACPMPIVKTKKAVDALAAGQVLKMIATDPGSVADVAAWAKKTGNSVLESGREGAKFIFYIKKTA